MFPPNLLELRLTAASASWRLAGARQTKDLKTQKILNDARQTKDSHIWRELVKKPPPNNLSTQTQHHARACDAPIVTITLPTTP